MVEMIPLIFRSVRAVIRSSALAFGFSVSQPGSRSVWGISTRYPELFLELLLPGLVPVRVKTRPSPREGKGSDLVTGLQSFWLYH